MMSDIDPDQERRNQILRELREGPTLSPKTRDVLQDSLLLFVALAFAGVVIIITLAAIVHF
jgi:hypothetical protein